MKEQVEFFDIDFLGNKIEIGDKVIFEAPGYRHFVLGTVITKAPKSCQVEYINDWNYNRDEKVPEVVRQGYGQVIKHSIKEGKWIDFSPADWQCSECYYIVMRYNNTPYCPNCGAKMEG